MDTETYLSKQLQKFSKTDFALVKLTYLFFGFLIISLYPALISLSWIFYLLLIILCAFPLYIHLFSLSGNYQEKLEQYLKTNNPSNQVLLFLSLFFTSCFITTLFPMLAEIRWYVYLIIMFIFALIPMRKTWFW